jgi:hypothetical protein
MYDELVHAVGHLAETKGGFDASLLADHHPRRREGLPPTPPGQLTSQAPYLLTKRRQEDVAQQGRDNPAMEGRSSFPGATQGLDQSS